MPVHEHLTYSSVSHFPAEDEKLRATSLTHRRGGNGPNTLEVLHQLVKNKTDKLLLSLCCVLPSEDSPAVEEVKKSLGERIDFSLCIYRPKFTEAASSYIISSQETGSRTIVNYNELPEMEVAELVSIADKVKDESCWYHFEVRQAIQYWDIFLGAGLTSLLITGTASRRYPRIHCVSTHNSSRHNN